MEKADPGNSTLLGSLKSSYNSCVDLAAKQVLFEQSRIKVAYLPASQRLKATAGTVLQRCFAQIETFRLRMGRSVCVYKIGMSSNPLIRFHYYQAGNYSEMSLLHVTTNMGEAQMLEAALIAQNMNEKGCRNEKFGGDGPNHLPPEPYYFVYVVGARADSLKPIR